MYDIILYMIEPIEVYCLYWRSSLVLLDYQRIIAVMPLRQASRCRGSLQIGAVHGRGTR